MDNSMIFFDRVTKIYGNGQKALDNVSLKVGRGEFVFLEGDSGAGKTTMLELILKRLRPVAAKRGIELVLESFRTVSADCDEMKLTLAFTNLVENAIKYNVAGGFVQVSLDADHKYFYVKVSDSGIGIPEEFQEKIFERFYRVDKARSRETGGTGLGLAITKNIILMHDGAIKVKSKEDEGTTFTVRIPLTVTL